MPLLRGTPACCASPPRSKQVPSGPSVVLPHRLGSTSEHRDYCSPGLLSAPMALPGSALHHWYWHTSRFGNVLQTLHKLHHQHGRDYTLALGVQTCHERMYTHLINTKDLNHYNLLSQFTVTHMKYNVAELRSHRFSQYLFFLNVSLL